MILFPTGSPLSETHGRCAKENHYDMQASVLLVSRQAKAPKDPPFGRRVVMLDVVGVMHFRLKSENAPVLVESADPFFKRGLGLLSFGIFPLQEQRKVQKKQ